MAAPAAPLQFPVEKGVATGLEPTAEQSTLLAALVNQTGEGRNFRRTLEQILNTPQADLWRDAFGMLGVESTMDPLIVPSSVYSRDHVDEALIYLAIYTFHVNRPYVGVVLQSARNEDLIAFNTVVNGELGLIKGTFGNFPPGSMGEKMEEMSTSILNSTIAQVQTDTLRSVSTEKVPVAFKARDKNGNIKNVIFKASHSGLPSAVVPTPIATAEFAAIENNPKEMKNFNWRGRQGRKFPFAAVPPTQVNPRIAFALGAEQHALGEQQAAIAAAQALLEQQGIDPAAVDDYIAPEDGVFDYDGFYNDWNDYVDVAAQADDVAAQADFFEGNDAEELMNVFG